MTHLPKIEPMKLSLRSKPFDDPDWIFELKRDGFRSLAYVSDGACKLVSRRLNVYRRFRHLQAALAGLKVRSAILDGEIICLDSHGRSVFNALVHRRSAPVFYAFDLVWLDGQDLRKLPLFERKRSLRALLRGARKANMLKSPS